jgi:D-glycero-D-manno-heptose 1,7-bisphosphate phosphatase
MGAEQRQGGSSKRRAVFLDRDGTISEEYGYANHISRFQMFPFAAAAIRRLNEARIPVIVVTNQSGVARGYFGEGLVERIHLRMRDELAAAGAHVDGVYYCPHVRADGCRCRKPEVGMLEQAAREHTLQVEGSTVVGDRYSDVALGHAAGCRSIFVLTGYGRGDYEEHHASWPRQPDDVVENLAEAVELILKDRT